MTAIEALFFDQDGVIIDTERDGHRVAFNRAFEEHQLEWHWDVNNYHRLIQVAGGKERIRHYIETQQLRVKTDLGLAEFVAGLHARKTEIFVQMIEAGELATRPGVRRLMLEAKSAGACVAICTTANELSANAVVRNALDGIAIDFVLAGDVVKNKKPDPEIYRTAVERSGLRTEQCVVIEDSHVGVAAAKSAGLSVIATTSTYTVDEDLSHADIQLSCLGDAEGEHAMKLDDVRIPNFDGVLRFEQIDSFFSSD